MGDLITRKAAVSRISDLLICELKGKRIPTWNEVYNAIGDIPSVPAVPLETLLKFIEQTEHFTYPPCQNELEKCRDCKLHYTFGSQKECWKQFLTKWMEEQQCTSTATQP